MRIFEQFNKNSVCKICGTNKDGTAVLISVFGTQGGNIAEAEQYHLDCINLSVIHKEGLRSIIYQTFEGNRK